MAVDGLVSPAADSAPRLTVVRQGLKDVRTFEFGVRLDRVSEVAALTQVRLAQDLRRGLSAVMEDAYRQSQSLIRDWGGAELAAMEREIEVARDEMRRAAAARDRPAWVERRSRWRSLVVARVRRIAKILAEHREELKRACYSRVGNKIGCETYALRCQAVERGLGWGTANKVLDEAMIEWNTATKRGRCPRLRNAGEGEAEGLWLLFIAGDRGGVDVDALLNGRRLDLRIDAPATPGARQYGTFAFRLGPASDEVWAEGTWQQHREMPTGARVLSARLVCRSSGSKRRWALQLIARLVVPVRKERSSSDMVVVHTGWARLPDGRAIAAAARGPDVGDVELFVLPSDVEERLREAENTERKRAASLEDLLQWLGSRAFKGIIAAQGFGDPAEALRRSRGLLFADEVYAFRDWLRVLGVRIERLDQWVRDDRREWQSAAGASRRARGRRLVLYRSIAQRLADMAELVILSVPEPTYAAGDGMGSPGVVAERLRGGRWVAAGSMLRKELEAAVRDRDGVMLECAGSDGPTVCLACGSGGVAVNAQRRTHLICSDCGHEIDRRAHAAVWLWRQTREEWGGLVRGAKSELHRLALIRNEAKAARNKGRLAARLGGQKQRRRAASAG